MPDWPEEELPSTKQVEVYLLFWEHQQKPLAPDPGIGSLQKSFWLDPEELDISAHQAECYRANRLDRGLFIRRLIATYHKRTRSRPISHAARAKGLTPTQRASALPMFSGLASNNSMQGTLGAATKIASTTISRQADNLTMRRCVIIFSLLALAPIGKNKNLNNSVS